MPPNRTPVFFDIENRRWRRITRISFTLAIFGGLGVGIFVLSVLSLPLLPHHNLPRIRAEKDTGNPDPVLVDRLRRKRQVAGIKEVKTLKAMIAKDMLANEKQAKEAQLNAKPLPSLAQFSPKRPISMGFYVNWEETSRASLERNIDSLTHFVPEWLHISETKTTIVDSRIPEDREEITPLVRNHGIPIVPLINNFIDSTLHEHQGHWSTEALHNLVSSAPNRTKFIHDLKDMMLRERWQGVNIDFEQPASEDKNNLTLFMKELYAEFHAIGLIVCQDLAIDDPNFDRPSLVAYNDFIIPMVYDEHSPGADGGGAGSIASMRWTEEQLHTLFNVERVPPQKVVLGIGNYAYDWKEGDYNAEPVSFQSAIMQAKESKDPQDPQIAKVTLDPDTLNPYYRYFDDVGKSHAVWMLDATTTYNQLRIARKYPTLGVALWYMGGEDPSVWQVIGKDYLAKDQGSLMDNGTLNTVSYHNQSQVDFQGEGELLEVTSEPSDGKRTLKRNPTTGFITELTYQVYPSSYVVRRAGYRPKTIVLSFDDGPDPAYTSRILDILKANGVKATFFVVGSQVAENPDLLARIWNEGHEIGNHTFTHPDLRLVGRSRTLVEINATQRAIESITGHTTFLFRPPYAIDVEPRTSDDLKPILIASERNFISVGEQIDPEDWNLTKMGAGGVTGAERLIEHIWRERDKGNVVLLHDGGGNREETIKALPTIIKRLKAAGYKFGTVADLRGVSREVLFPPIQGFQVVLVGIDHWIFEANYFVQRSLTTLFSLSVILGISRQLLMGLLALIQRRRERKREATYSPDFRIGVSVVIAAYNEEKVIARTVQGLLESEYPIQEIIVIDDGSSDATFTTVQQSFLNEPSIRVFRKENGGKASALNFGLQYVTGEAIVALDADTVFARDTIGKLVRHFENPKVGAVAGNVQVGNISNLLTRWQALEYITSQNFDRRAYEMMNCITVVPGAVGAWRLTALQQAGGYTHDTLAEDTDLTWTVRRLDWQIENDSTALAFTEAPESLKNLSRQRFRWAFGTLQNLWKHRSALGQHGAFGILALPSLWLYQILFPAISPIMDIAVVWALFAGNFANVIRYYVAMVLAEFLGAALAIWMDKNDWKLLPSLFIQRFVYRQLMYYVILRSIFSALKGGAVGWNKFERTGSVRAIPTVEDK
ncbi:MAG: glycosyltransferase [Armatimonadetes bacterium]|nr:glycosyltransferase [Armatimonadota bacterium]